jgi:hypothetical protein
MKRQLRLQRAVKRIAEGRRGRRRSGRRATVGMKVAAAKQRPTAISFGKRWATLFWGRGAACGVDEDEVSGDNDSEDEVEVDGFGFESREKRCEGDGGEEDSQQEGGAVVVVEVVAGFELFVVADCVDVEDTGVHQTIGGVEHPDGESHGQCGSDRKVNVAGRGDEPGPESGDGWGVEGEKMPERERVPGAADRF